jgi:hypothetical protein
MKLSLSLLFTATATALTEGDILARFETLEVKNAVIKAENAEITAKYAEIQATLNATTAGELKVFNTDECPPGWVEFNKTQGYLLTGRPKGGETGTTINRPLDVGEEGRSPEHSHEVGVEDLGHTHVTAVNDPGHNHSLSVNQLAPAAIDPNAKGYPFVENPIVPSSLYKQSISASDTAKTGINIDMLPAKSNIQVSLASNEDGEGYPLVYVLICQRALEN